LENTQGSLQSRIAGFNSDGLGSNIVIQYSVGSIITSHGRITAREYTDKLGSQVHPMIQTLFPKNYAIFQAETVQSWFEDHEGELQHFP
jgi:hypothetical protein